MLIRKIHSARKPRAARSLVASSTQYLTASTGFGLGANDACYIVTYARRDNTTSTQVLAGLVVAGTTNDQRILGTGGTDSARVICYDTAGATAIAASAAGALTQGSWVSAIGEFGSSASRRIITNGVVVSNTTSRALTVAPDTFRVGVNGIVAQAWTGSFAHVALFAGTASDTLITLHTQGVHPTGLPGQLIECWEFGRPGPLVGLVGGVVLSAVNGSGLTDGPNIQGPPTLTRRVYLDLGGGATFQPAWVRHVSPMIGTGLR